MFLSPLSYFINDVCAPDISHCVKTVTLQPDGPALYVTLLQLEGSGVDPGAVGNPLLQPIIPASCVKQSRRSVDFVM